MEEKPSEEQFGFRKGRGTMDAVYVLNWVVNREIRIAKRKVFVFFADLKVAFDRVDRRKFEDRL